MGGSSIIMFAPEPHPDTDLFDARVNHHFSDKTTFYSRYSFNNVNTFLPGTFPLVSIGSVSGVQPGAGTFGSANAEFAGKSAERQMQLGATVTHIFKANLLGEAKFGFMRNQISSLSANDGLSPATAMGYTGVNVAGLPQTDGLPSFILGNGFTGLGDTAFQPEFEMDNSFEYLADLVYSPANHILKFGATLIQRQASNDQSIFPRGAGFMVGAAIGDINDYAQYVNPAQGIFAVYPQAGPLEDLVTGQAESIERMTGLVAPQFRSWEPSVYAQDDWRITHKITLNLGVRYDIFTPYTAANNAISNFDFSKNLIVGPLLTGANKSNATAGVNTYYGDVAPRIGFAIDAGRGTVIRGGFGMSYFPGNFTLQSFMKNPPYAASFTCGFVSPPSALPCVGTGYGGLANYGPFYVGVNYALGSEPTPAQSQLTAPQLATPGDYAGQMLYAMDFNFKPTYVEQYSLQVQKDYKGNVFGIGYVGNLGRRLVGYPNLNQPAYGATEDASGNVIAPAAPTPITGIPSSTIVSTGVSSGDLHLQRAAGYARKKAGKRPLGQRQLHLGACSGQIVPTVRARQTFLTATASPASARATSTFRVPRSTPPSIAGKGTTTATPNSTSATGSRSLWDTICRSQAT